jgi:WD40 repeat protein
MDSELIYCNFFGADFKLTKMISKKTGIILEQKQDIASCLLISSDNKFIITGGDNGIINIFHYKKNYLKVTLQGNEDTIFNLL